MSIIINTLSYNLPDGDILFQNINISVMPEEKISLIGANGVGKTSLLNIISGTLQAASGEVFVSETPYYIPQHLGQYDHKSIQEVLQVDKKIEALQAILQGNVTNENLMTLDDNWEIEAKTEAALNYWGLKVDIKQNLSTLSGGEKTKVFLAGMQIHSPRIILMDEPSNHLDLSGRMQLYETIQKTKSTMLICSHDRSLLNLLDKTLELTPTSIEVYGGNYDFYRNQKDTQAAALESQLNEVRKNIKQTQHKTRELIEQRQKQEVRGKSQKAKAGIPRIILGSLKNKAEITSSTMKNKQLEKTDDLKMKQTTILKEIKAGQILKICFKNSYLHEGKILIDAHDINLNYGSKNLWDCPLNLTVKTGERIHIKGRNGSGKTSLLRILSRELEISAGNIRFSDFKLLYLDQEYSMIRNEISIIEQMNLYNI